MHCRTGKLYSAHMSFNEIIPVKTKHAGRTVWALQRFTIPDGSTWSRNCLRKTAAIGWCGNAQRRNHSRESFPAGSFGYVHDILSVP